MRSLIPIGASLFLAALASFSAAAADFRLIHIDPDPDNTRHATLSNEGGPNADPVFRYSACTTAFDGAGAGSSAGAMSLIQDFLRPSRAAQAKATTEAAE